MADEVVVDVVVDKEKLANLVSEHEWLFNKAHREYKNKSKCHLTWVDIAQKLGISGI